jgi:hypothetical protein
MLLDQPICRRRWVESLKVNTEEIPSLQQFGNCVCGEVPSIRFALRIVNRLADQQCGNERVAQLRRGRRGTTQMRYRDRDDVGGGGGGRQHDTGGEHDVDQPVVVAERRADAKKIIGAAGRSWIGLNSLLWVGSVMTAPGSIE